MCLSPQKHINVRKSEVGEEVLSNSLFHFDNVKSFPSSRREVYENSYTESCVSTAVLLLFIRRSGHTQNMLWEACSPAESTLKELIIEVQLCLHFPKLGPVWAS